MKTNYLKTKEGTIVKTDSPQYWPECEKLSRAEGSRLYREQQKDFLRKRLHPGDTVTCILRNVSSSGMSRRITLAIPSKEGGGVMDISGWAADVLEWRRNDQDGALVVGGCGMDMGFHTVYCLSRSLFPDGFGTIGVKDGRQKRPATRKEAEKMVKAGWSFRGRNGDITGWDNDGGYALDYRWL